MTDATLEQSTKRKLLTLYALLPWASGCGKAAQTVGPDSTQRRFKDIAAVLVVDAVAGAELEYVKICDDRGIEIHSSGIVSKGSRDHGTGRHHIPLTVRAVWRRGAGWDKVRQLWNEGVIAGDYTIPVAECIPNEVLSDIRAHGGTCV